MIEQTIVIRGATSKQIYEVLLDSELHSKLTGEKATIDPHVGGQTSTFDGYAIGVLTKLVPNAEIQQTWRASDWPDGHYSHITFLFTDTDHGTRIDFTQTDLPKGAQAEFESGWRDFYWEPLKTYFS